MHDKIKGVKDSQCNTSVLLRGEEGREGKKGREGRGR